MRQLVRSFCLVFTMLECPYSGYPYAPYLSVFSPNAEKCGAE